MVAIFTQQNGDELPMSATKTKLLKRLMREPLVHFVLVAALVFLIAAQGSGSVDDAQTIQVSTQDIAKQLQLVEPGLSLNAATTKVASLADPQLNSLINTYAEQEALYREAVKLELNENDHVVRSRMIQRMKFLLQGMEQTVTPDEAQLGDYFKQNADRYAVPAKLSFKHLFFATNADQPERAQQRALAAMSASSESTVPRGDSFPYQKAYLDRSADQIARHFGYAFAEQIFTLDAAPGTWQGPIASAYGMHLVNVTSTYTARAPAYKEVRDRVLRDYLRDANADRNRAMIDKVVKNYRVERVAEK